MKSVILVGNGPSVLKKKNGNLINSFDTVIRFNSFHIDGYEEFVGTKTDIWAVNLGYIYCGDKWNFSFKQPRTIIYIPYTLTLYPGYEETKNRTSEELCPVEVAKESDKFFTGNTWASTGLMAVLHFKPCYITGFDSFLSVKHHYGDDKSEFSHHNGILEHKFISEKIKRNELIVL